MLVMLAHLPRRASITSISGPLGACSFGLLKEFNLHTFKSRVQDVDHGAVEIISQDTPIRILTILMAT